MKAITSSHQTSEAELVERLRAGDQTAIEELYHVHKDRLYSFILQRVGRREGVAEDIVQETFLAALNSLYSFRGDSQPYTWLRSIAYHKICDFHRRQAREASSERLDLDIDTISSKRTQGSKSAAPSLPESEGDQNALRQAMAALPRDYGRVLQFKYFEDMSVSAISRNMERSPKSVEGLLSRARKALRTTLSKQVVRTANPT